MARIDVHTAKLPSGKIEVRLDTRLLADLDDEEAGELATQLLSRLGCSFEIKWPHLQPSDDERFAEQRAARARLNEDARAYATEHTPPAHEQIEHVVANAYKAGWKASPKPVTTIIR